MVVTRTSNFFSRHDMYYVDQLLFELMRLSLAMSEACLKSL